MRYSPHILQVTDLNFFSHNTYLKMQLFHGFK